MPEPHVFRKPPALVTISGAVLIAIASLSIHVVMLQVLGIPHPDFSSVGIWGLLVPTGQTFGLIVLAGFSAHAFRHAGLFRRALLLAATNIILTDQIRLAVMGGVTTHSFAFPAITFAAEAAGTLVTALFATVAARFLRANLLKLMGAIAITGFSTLAVQPILNAAVAPFASLQRPEIITEPYSVGILSISYTLFVFTVLAVVAIAWIVCPRMSARARTKLFQFALLILLLRGMLIAQLLFPWLMAGAPARSALEISQFFLQDLAMAAMVWGLWCRTQPMLPDMATA